MEKMQETTKKKRGKKNTGSPYYKKIMIKITRIRKIKKERQTLSVFFYILYFLMKLKIAHNFLEYAHQFLRRSPFGSL